MVVDITTSRYTITTTPIPPQHHLPPRRHCGFRLSTIKGACGFKPHEGRVWFCSQPHRGAYGSGQPPQGCVCFRGSATTRKECVVVGLWQPMRVAFGLLKPTRMRSGFGSHGTSKGRLFVSIKSPVYHETSVASVVSASVVDRSIGTDNPHLSLGLQADLWCIEHLRYYFLGCLAEHPTFVGHSNLLIEVVILIAEHWEHSRRVDIKT
ncbi:hypothetical protein Tco_1272455 [Tanacetum coccineum]